jgi:hypothetical protein
MNAGQPPPDMTLTEAGAARLVVTCACGRTSILSCVALALQIGGERSIGEIAARLRCRDVRCYGTPASIVLRQPPPRPEPVLQKREAGHRLRHVDIRDRFGSGISFSTLGGVGADELPMLLIQRGVIRMEVPAEEALRLARFMAWWWFERS